MDRSQQFVDIINDKGFLEATFALEYEENEVLISNLSCILTLSGISSFDVSANPQAVSYVKSGIDKASLISKALFEKINHRPFIKISLGALNPFIEEYHCIGSKKGIFSIETLKENLSNCIKAGSEIIEFHLGMMEEDKFLDIWTIISQFSGDFPSSLNLNRVFLSNAHLVNLIKKAYLITEERTLLQVDGATSEGKDEDYSSTLQSLATSDILIKDLKVKERRKYKKLNLTLCGDINSKTTALALICNIDYCGLSLGHHHIVSSFEFIKPKIESIDLKEDMEQLKDIINIVKSYLDKYRVLQ